MGNSNLIFFQQKMLSKQLFKFSLSAMKQSSIVYAAPRFFCNENPAVKQDSILHNIDAFF